MMKDIPLRLMSLAGVPGQTGYTGIEWASFSANLWGGCTKIKARPGGRSGCDICYAEAFCTKRLGIEWGAGKPRRRFKSTPARLRRLNRLAGDMKRLLARGESVLPGFEGPVEQNGETGNPFAVFMHSLSDWADQEVAKANPEWQAELVDLVEECTDLDFLLLTHRPQNISKVAPARWLTSLPGHIWPGVTVDDATAIGRWHELADIWGDTGRAWVSAEPLAGSMSGVSFEGAAALIVGGASNTEDPEWRLQRAWLDDLVDRYAEILFFKQWGVFDETGVYVGDKKRAGRNFDDRLFDITPWARNRDLLAAAANDNAIRRKVRRAAV